MPRKPTTRKTTRVSHAGTRRSEKVAPVVETVPVAATGKTFRGLENEDPRFPGMRTVIVPKDDPRDTMHMSPVGAYQGRGYETLSEDTLYTGHAGHVLMGIDVEEYNKREDARLNEHNSRFVNGYADDITSTRQDDPLKFYKDRSGMRNPNHKIPSHAQLAALRTH